MDSEWVPVPSLKYYEVTRDGRIRTHLVRTMEQKPVEEGKKPRKEVVWNVLEEPISVKILKSKKCGSLSVFVRHRGRTVRRPLNSIILETFHRPRFVEVAININGDKSDNRIENLKWGTMDEARQAAQIAGNRKKNKLNIEKAREIKRRALAGEKSKDLAAEFSISQSVVANIASGRAWKMA